MRERIKVNPGVHQKDGKWFLRIDDRSDGVAIDPDIASVIKASMWVEKHQRSNDILRNYFQNINCHQVALFSAGVLRAEGMSERSNYEVSLFKLNEFKKYKTVAEFTEYLQRQLGNKLGVAQIIELKSPVSEDISVSTRLMHSFLAGVDPLGRVVCYEKRGARDPFRIVPLEKIFRERWYQPPSDFAWAARPIEDIEGSEGAESARREIEKITMAQKP